MNPALEHLMRAAAPGESRRLRFALACAERVRHLLENPEVGAQLDVLQAYVEGRTDRATLERSAATAAGLATRHRGSTSIDGTAHAAVSATHAVSKAVAGRATEAADYAAYAMVYAYSSSAVTDPGAYAGEHAWQVEAWNALAAA